MFATTHIKFIFADIDTVLQRFLVSYCQGGPILKFSLPPGGKSFDSLSQMVI